MKRSTPLRRCASLRRTGPIKRTAIKRSRGRSGGASVSKRQAREQDTERLRWTRQQPCCAPVYPPCTRPSDAHHPRIDTVGMGLRGADDTAIGLCRVHHDQLHSLSGIFKGWSGDGLGEWERARIGEHRARYAARSAA